MATPASGTLSMSVINQEFVLGNSLSVYRGQIYYQGVSSSAGYFPSVGSPISFSLFYGKNKTDQSGGGIGGDGGGSG